MKIIVLAQKNPFANPGAEANRLLGLLKGLSKLDNQVILLVLGGYYNSDESEKYADKGVIEDIHYKYLSKKKNITIWQRRISEYLYLFFETFFMSRKVNKYLKTVPKNSIIWLQNGALCYSLVKQSDINQYKIFVEMNEYPDIHKGINSQKYIWQRWFSDRKIEIFYNEVLNRIDGFALMTEALLEHFKVQLNKRTKVLHLPMTVDLERFDLTKNYKPITGLNAPYICFVGSMNDAKDGVNLLIEAFASISEEFPNYKLALFGFWAYDSANHQKRILELGMQDKIIYSKPIDSENVVNLMMNADLLVLPRPDSYQAKGGFPTKLGEYLATSKPIIVSKVGEIPIYLKDNQDVFFAEPGSIISLKDKLMQVLTDKNKADIVGKRGRVVAEQVFSKDIQSKRLLDFLEKI
jgi:glycosyltransferase involved in cell wall biosynthesis